MGEGEGEGGEWAALKQSVLREKSAGKEIKQFSKNNISDEKVKQKNCKVSEKCFLCQSC